MTVNIRNKLVTFQNIYVKPYNYQTKKTDISHSKTANSLIEILLDKPINEKILTLFNYLKPQKLY